MEYLLRGPDSASHTILRSITFLCVALLSSCSYGPPLTRAHVANAMAKPDSHSIAVAVKYQKFREPTGVNSFPNGGIPKILDQKAKIYVCNANTAQMKRVACIAPEESVRLAWEPWILGWIGDTLYFQVSGQPGTTLKDIQNARPVVYSIDTDGRVSQETEAPTTLEFQNNTGPLPQGTFVRISKGHDTIDVRTENTDRLRTLFKAEANDGELVPVIDSKN